MEAVQATTNQQVEVSKLTLSFRRTELGTTLGVNVDDEKAKYLAISDASAFSIDAKTKKVFWKRPSLPLLVSTPTKAGIIAAMQDEKQSAFIVDVVKDAIFSVYKNHASNALDNDPYLALGEALFPEDKFSLQAIANMPKAERGSGITREMLVAFGVEYKATMLTEKAQGIAGKVRAPEILDVHCQIIESRLASIRGNLEFVAQMNDLLDIWLASANEDAQSEHSGVYEHLKQQCEKYLAVTKLQAL